MSEELLVYTGLDYVWRVSMNINPRKRVGPICSNSYFIIVMDKFKELLYSVGLKIYYDCLKIILITVRANYTIF